MSYLIIIIIITTPLIFFKLSRYGNIKTQPKEPSPTDDGILITSAPEDIFNIIRSQVEVAHEKLSWSRLKDIINTSIEVLHQIQQDFLKTLESDFTDISPEIIAAAVNDNQRMQENCEDFAEKIRELLPDNDVREAVITKLEDISSEFVSNSAKSVHYLTRFFII